MYVLDCVLYPKWSSTVVRRREEKQAVIPEHSAAQRIKAVTLQLISISLAFPKDPLVSLPACLLAFACACPRASGRLPAFADTASSHILTPHSTTQHSTVNPNSQHFHNARARAADGTHADAGVWAMIDSSQGVS